MKALILSVVLHMLLFGWLFLSSTRWVHFDIFRPRDDGALNLKVSKPNTVRVDVLDLPEFEKFIAPKAPVATSEPRPALPDLRSASRSPKEPAKAVPKPDNGSKRPIPKKDDITQARQKLIRELRARAGNKLQAGSAVARLGSSRAQEQWDASPFWTELMDSIEQKWRVYSQFKIQGLVVVYRVYLGENQRLTKIQLVQPSDSREYDEYVRDFLENDLQIDVPIPDDLRSYLIENGFFVQFEPD
jgi:hypothetical protein